MKISGKKLHLLLVVDSRNYGKLKKSLKKFASKTSRSKLKALLKKGSA